MIKRHINGSDLARITGMSYSDISQIINLKKDNVSLASIVKIADALGSPIEECFADRLERIRNKKTMKERIASARQKILK